MKTIFLFIILVFIIKLNSFSQEIVMQKIIPPQLNGKIFIDYASKTFDNGIIMYYINYTDIENYIILKFDSNFNTEWSYHIDSSYLYLAPFSSYITQNKDLSYTYLGLKIQDYFFDFGKIFKFDFSTLGDSLSLNIKLDSTHDVFGTPLFYSLGDGTYIYSIGDWSVGNFYGAYWVKIDSSANTIWKKKLNDSTNKMTLSRPEKTLNNGFIFTSGIVVEIGQPHTQMYIIKTDLDCNELLRRQLDFGEYSILLNNIIPAKDSGYVLTATFRDTTNNNKYIAVVKVNNNLEMEWTKLFQGDIRNKAYNIISNDKGELFVLGITSKMKYNNAVMDSSTQKGYLLKLNSNGEKIWDIKLGQDSVYNDFQYLLKAGNDEYYCVGDSRDSIMLIKIRDNTTAVKDLAKINSFNITPNPFSNSFSNEFFNKTSSNVSIDLYDILGNIIYSKNLGFLDSGIQSTTVQLNDNYTPGCYLVVVRCGTDVQCMKVMKSE